ncbi:hypothetical protein RFI_09872 [Reticulomyxa filosa]|uniref:Uncharacterized protein n=1 Tax=Reticulomyxa filosa TaxID=46433 RepID=X6NMM5_RETFI|nr:hypothetical protein RFI_09872 [Reticulomyxa filosa]|eukprot:ETO27261.1 hypothetical protein RFI_09872 [Reticulomyxa filosa]
MVSPQEHKAMNRLHQVLDKTNYLLQQLSQSPSALKGSMVDCDVEINEKEKLKKKKKGADKDDEKKGKDKDLEDDLILENAEGDFTEEELMGVKWTEVGLLNKYIVIFFFF